MAKAGVGNKYDGTCTRQKTSGVFWESAIFPLLPSANLMHVFSLRRNTLQPRLFQQACRLASSSTRRLIARSRRLAAQQPPRPARRSDQPRDDEEDAIRWFEKDVETGVVRRVEGNPEELEAQELRGKIAALEKELKEYRNEESNEDMLAALEPEDREKMEKALAERDQYERHLTTDLTVSLDLPPLSIPLIKRFNQALKDAALAPTMITRRKDLWRWYNRAKYGLPALSSMIPKKAWQLLWRLQSRDSPSNPDRLHHMEQLLRDMASIDMEIMPSQSLVYIDTLLSLGRIDEAFSIWQLSHDTASTPSRGLLTLGIRLFSQNGRPEQAQNILVRLFNLYPDHNPRIILPILEAHLRAKEDKLAFGCYVMINLRLGKNMTMEDYDVICLSFLEHGEKNLALAVFRDMMLRAPAEADTHHGTSVKKRDYIYNRVFERMRSLTSTTTNATEVNEISLTTLSVLPTEWQNKFFYGSWLKKLLGMHQLEAATKVVELMYERGVRPDPKHINGLIGGFFRSDKPSLHERGEAMAWKMIQLRMHQKYLERRAARGEDVNEHDSSNVPSIYDTEDETVKIPAHLERSVPPASIETFNVLALYYSMHEKWALVHHLDKMRRPAVFKMDSAFLNQILNMIFNNKDESHLWHRFLKEAKHVSPDFETYHILWTGQLQSLNVRRNLASLPPDHHLQKEQKAYPSPRQLFALQTCWLSRPHPRGLARVTTGFTLEIYTKIISSFSAAKDFAGCLVALHSIAGSLSSYPDAEIARIIMTGVSNLSSEAATCPVPTIRGHRGRQQIPASEARLKNTAKVMAQLASKRAQAQAEKGINILTLDVQERKEESLNLMSEFLRLVLVRLSGGDVGVAEGLIGTAKREMMVPEEMRTGDKDCAGVVV
jgi:tetratricopeptide (TPR) repeat protein